MCTYMHILAQFEQISQTETVGICLQMRACDVRINGVLTSYPSSLRNSLMSGGSVPKNLVNFFTLEGLDRAGSSESLIRGCDCDLTIAMLVCVLRAAISHFMLSISCENLAVVESWKFQLVSHRNFWRVLSPVSSDAGSSSPSSDGPPISPMSPHATRDAGNACWCSARSRLCFITTVLSNKP